MGDLAAIYIRLVGARVRSQVQYRASFALELTGNALLSFVDFLAIGVIFSHLSALGGWSLSEIAFLYGTSYVAFRLTDMAIGHLDSTGQLIQSGEFDIFMVRPLGSLFQMITSDFSLRQVGGLIQGAAVLAVALTRVPIDWTPGRVALMLTMPFTGAVIFGSVWVTGITLSFWTVRSGEAVNAFTYGGNQLTTFPLNIYAAWMRRLFAFVVPLAFVNYLPSLYILDKHDPLGLPGVLRFCSPLVAALAAVVARRVWNLGVRHYRSTGS